MTSIYEKLREAGNYVAATKGVSIYLVDDGSFRVLYSANGVSGAGGVSLLDLEQSYINPLVELAKRLKQAVDRGDDGCGASK